MDPKLLNFFTNLTSDIEQYLTSYATVEQRFQEAFDRQIDAVLQELDFAGTGDLDHLDPEALQNAFAAFSAIQVTMNANDRSRWSALLETVRSWNS